MNTQAKLTKAEEVDEIISNLSSEEFRAALTSIVARLECAIEQGLDYSEFDEDGSDREKLRRAKAKLITFNRYCNEMKKITKELPF